LKLSLSNLSKFL